MVHHGLEDGGNNKGKYKRGDLMKKLGKVLLTTLLACSIFATSVYAEPTSQQMQEQVDELEEQVEQAEDEMSSLQSEMTELMTAMAETEEQLIEIGEQVIKATEDLEEAEQRELQQMEDMKHRIVAMYESGQTSILEVIFESGSISEMLTRAENVQAIHEYDRAALDEFVATKNKVANLKETLESEQARLNDVMEQNEQLSQELSEKIKEKKAEVENFQEQLEEAAAQAARIAAEEARRKAEEEEKRKAQESQDNKNNNNNNNSSSGTVDTSNWANGGNGDVNVGAAIVAAARTYMGVPYAWGGTNYKGIDCSGLTMRAHEKVGISIPRTSTIQRQYGKAVNGLANALPGDIICYDGHVGIYIGNNKIIHAPCDGYNVMEAGVYLGGTKEILAIRRYW